MRKNTQIATALLLFCSLLLSSLVFAASAQGNSEQDMAGCTRLEGHVGSRPAIICLKRTGQDIHGYFQFFAG